MRILTEIPIEDVQELDALASKKNCSRAAVIRDAVRLYLLHNADNNEWIQRGRGFWKDRMDNGEGIVCQMAICEDRTSYDEL